MVTRRIRPLVVEGRVVHQVGLPFHWSFAGETVGGNANDLTSLLADPNFSMREAKAFTCQVESGRLSGRVAHPTVPPMTWPDRAPIPGTPAASQPEGKFNHSA
jgi:formate dehydrogenase major subunit